MRERDTKAWREHTAERKRGEKREGEGHRKQEDTRQKEEAEWIV